MAEKIIFRAGEATVLAREGQFTDAMPEVLIGDVSGPVGHAFANMMGQSVRAYTDVRHSRVQSLGAPRDLNCAQSNA